MKYILSILLLLFSLSGFSQGMLLAGGTEEAAVNTPLLIDSLSFYVDGKDINSNPQSGTTWFDLGPNGYDITLLNGAFFTSVAASFDGIDDRSTLNSNLMASGSQTWVVYINIDDNTNETYPGILGGKSIGINTLRGGVAFTISGPNIELDTYSSSNRVFGREPYVLGDWEMYSISFDQGNSEVCFYKNQNLVNCRVLTDIDYSGTPSIEIGANYRNSNLSFFDGQIGAVVKYNKPLSATEIADLYNYFSN